MLVPLHTIARCFCPVDFVICSFNNQCQHTGYTDPSGHCFIFCIAAIGAAIGAVVNAVAYTVQVASTGQAWDAGAFVGAVATGAATGAVTAMSFVVEPIDYAMTAVQCVTSGCSLAEVALTVVPGAIGPVAWQIDNVLDVARAVGRVVEIDPCVDPNGRTHGFAPTM